MLDKIYLCGILELGGGDRPLHRRSAAPASGEGGREMRTLTASRSLVELRDKLNATDPADQDFLDLALLPIFGGAEPNLPEIYSWDTEGILVNVGYRWEIIPR